MRTLLLATAILVSIPHVAVADPQPNPYLEAGIPAVGRAWSGPDYERTAEILGAAKVPLPRFSDPQGAALLERMTSTENFALQRDKSIQLSLRQADFIQLLQGANSVMKLYSSAAGEGGYRQEMARIGAFLVRCSAFGIDLADEMLPTSPKDEKYAARLASLQKMKDGMTSILVGSEQMLTPSNGFSPQDLSVFLEAMAESLPRMKRAFSADFRVELRKKLEADRPRFKSAEDVRRIDAMVAALAAP